MSGYLFRAGSSAIGALFFLITSLAVVCAYHHDHGRVGGALQHQASAALLCVSLSHAGGPAAVGVSGSDERSSEPDAILASNLISFFPTVRVDDGPTRAPPFNS